MIKLNSSGEPGGPQRQLRRHWDGEFPSTDARSETAFSSGLSDAEGHHGEKMRRRFQEIHGLVTLLPERSCSPPHPQLKHFATGSSIRSAYDPIRASQHQ
jgi:hypothetical protein